MVDQQALCKLGEGSWYHKGPHNTCTIDGTCHHEIAESPSSHDVSQSRVLHDNWERRALICTVHNLAATGGNQSSEGVEGRERASPLWGDYVSWVSLDRWVCEMFTIIFFVFNNYILMEPFYLKLLSFKQPILTLPTLLISHNCMTLYNDCCSIPLPSVIEIK